MVLQMIAKKKPQQNLLEAYFCLLLFCVFYLGEVVAVWLYSGLILPGNLWVIESASSDSLAAIDK